MYYIITKEIQVRQDIKVDKTLAKLGPGNVEIGNLQEYANYLFIDAK